MRIELEPIGHVRAPRPHAEDDFWGGEQRGAVRQPAWSQELMREYWLTK